MKAVVAAFNQEKALVGAFSVITNLWMELFEALVTTGHVPHVCASTHVSPQVHTYEEIVPTRSYVPHSRTFATAYSVVTHTATVTQDTAGGEQTLCTITRKNNAKFR